MCYSVIARRLKLDRVLEYMMDNAADREVWDMADQGKKKKPKQQSQETLMRSQIQDSERIILENIFTLKKALGYTGGKLDTLHNSELR